MKTEIYNDEFTIVLDELDGPSKGWIFMETLT